MAEPNPYATDRDVLATWLIGAVERFLGVDENRIDCLDHGFVRLVDVMGDDAAIVQAARVSYGKGTRTERDDEGLIRYLMRHHHTTPFEMCEVKLHCKMPLFVARQWIRHRTANVNEYSARYSILAQEFYFPEPENLAPQSAANRQGRAGELAPEVQAVIGEIIERSSKTAYLEYEKLLGPAAEPLLARELARMVLPANIYTEWYWKCDLHNIFHFLKLRMDKHAQYEIRVFAEAISAIVAERFPIAHRAFEDYQLHAVTFSRPAMAMIGQMVRDHLAEYAPPEKPADMSQREYQEALEALGLG